MMLWRLCSVLFATALLAIQTSSSDAECTKPRVRRAWTALSPDDRQLYLDSIASAMDSGAYIKFIEVHTEMMSELEAHRQCMFIYWHRLLLVSFENMLRAQGPKFECVTIPYWDWMTDYNNYVSGQCKNILDCSPALKLVGGAPLPPGRRTKTITINKEVLTGYCSEVAPLNHFCENSKVSGAKCAKCIPREDWSQVKFPGSASYASIRAQLFGANSIGQMSKAIEEGAHNNVHAVLGSTMGTFASPSDPIFWSHHAMIDLLHSIFHKCKVGEQKQTLDEKIKSVDWTTCERRNGGVFNPLDYVMMRTGYQGQNPINATQDPLIGKFFAGLPLQYGALTDTRDLGSSSYSFELKDQLSIMFTQCGKTTPPKSRNLQANSTDASTAPTSVPPPAMGTMMNTTTSITTKVVNNWVQATDETVKRRGGNPVLEAEKMACLFQDECLGGVTTYTEEFKRKFGITEEPRCKRIVDRIYRRNDTVKITEWKAQMMQSFGCPQPKSTAN